MYTEVIEADTIDEAAEKILIFLEMLEDDESPRKISSRDNVYYFDGWDGLGASAVLQVIARRLTAKLKEEPASAGSIVPAGLDFEQVIHIDCSKWESRRALQRAVAEQLELPTEWMGIFDMQDEQDDFHGVAQDSRTEVELVTRVMHEHIRKLNRRFLVIFHNGSSEEIDLATFCGFPLSGYSTNKVLWTFQGRFRLKPRAKIDSAMKSAGTTDAFLSAIPWKDPQELWPYLVHEEAEELVAVQHNISTVPHNNIDQPALVEECLLYMLELCSRGHQSIDFDFTTHGASYWICDGIIKQRPQKEREIDDAAADDDDGLWTTANVLRREVQLDVEHHQYSPSSHLARFVESKPYWASPRYGFSRQIPVPEVDMFQRYLDKLRVLKLSRCSFNFPSVPFRCCHNLRFLWFDHCQVIEKGSNTIGAAGPEDDDNILRCFQRLWVLDVRYTQGCIQILSTQILDLMTHIRELNVMGARDWDIGQLQGRLPNIRKLRVQKSTRMHCSCSENDLFSETSKMELLNFSGNETNVSMRSLCGSGEGNNNSCLETVIVDGCDGLHNISFKGCTNLKNVLLSGWLCDLRTVDISSTAVKTLDLTITEIYALDELYILYCEKLCAILWPPEDKRSKDKPRKLRIDTTQSSTQPARCGEQAEESSSPGTSLSSITVLHGNQLVSEFDWYVAVRDARLLVSLEPVYSAARKIYVEIFSTNIATGASEHERIVESESRSLMPVLSAQQQKQPACALIYADVTVENQQQGDDKSNGDAPGTVCMWPCPEAPHLPKESCYMHIQDRRGAITVPDFVIQYAKMLHVKDCLYITILPSAKGRGSEWPALEWCIIERCPKLEYVFGNDYYQYWYELRILWASQLPKACYIWYWGDRVVSNLTYLHLDFCPRLIHVFPVPLTMFSSEETIGFKCLETLEITWCGDLREVFPLGATAEDYLARKQLLVVTLKFPKLKSVHLHELPTLHSICGPGLRMSAPELEIVKIRGCWSLKRLPTVQRKAVQCDCEKEWWDSLRWEDASQKELYKPIHPKHYKKATLLRGTVLR